MEAAIKALQQGNVRIDVLHDISLDRGIRIHYSAGYRLWATKAERGHRGGIVIVRWEETGCPVKGTTDYVPNVVSLNFIAG